METEDNDKFLDCGIAWTIPFPEHRLFEAAPCEEFICKINGS
ncbi:MAG: hypothetical protein ACM3S2_22260 [Ignavibacteriales bacterium]